MMFRCRLVALLSVPWPRTEELGVAHRLRRKFLGVQGTSNHESDRVHRPERPQVSCRPAVRVEPIRRVLGTPLKLLRGQATPPSAREVHNEQRVGEIRRAPDANRQACGGEKTRDQLSRDGTQMARCTRERPRFQLGLRCTRGADGEAAPSPVTSLPPYRCTSASAPPQYPGARLAVGCT